MKSNDTCTTSGTDDKLEGNAKIALGKMKEETGKVLHSPNLKAKGNDEKNEGRVQKKIGEIKTVIGQ